MLFSIVKLFEVDNYFLYITENFINYYNKSLTIAHQCDIIKMLYFIKEAHMNTIECIKTRRSIRRFSHKAITKEAIEQIVSVAAYAPSWKNSQTTRYVCVLNNSVKSKIADECTLGFEHNTEIIKNAPAIVIISTVNARSGYERDGSFTTSKGTHWQSFDAGIAAQTFCLTAHENGLATVIMGIFDEQKVADIIKLPQSQSVSAIIALGYPNEQPTVPTKKTVDELLTII